MLSFLSVSETFEKIKVLSAGCVAPPPKCPTRVPTWDGWQLLSIFSLLRCSLMAINTSVAGGGGAMGGLSYLRGQNAWLSPRSEGNEGEMTYYPYMPIMMGLRIGTLWWDCANGRFEKPPVVHMCAKQQGEQQLQEVEKPVNTHIHPSDPMCLRTCLLIFWFNVF